MNSNFIKVACPQPAFMNVIKQLLVGAATFGDARLDPRGNIRMACVARSYPE